MLDVLQQFFATITTNPKHIASVVIDVLLVIFIIWRLFFLFRGTKGIAVLTILAVLFAIQLASRYLPLPFFNSFLQLISPMLVVAFPIIFQPELRRALEQLGRRNILSRLFLGSHPEAAKFIGGIVQAAKEMAGHRVGGLIVIERNQELSEVAASGVRLDATISPELIEQIFTLGGPLHDGAVIIKGQRILAASCLLPLSEQAKLGPGLGTRHRAGLGMSEASDALIIIVSEQRGMISLAVEGRLERDLSPDLLSSRLADLLLRDGREKVLADLRQARHRVMRRP